MKFIDDDSTCDLCGIGSKRVRLIGLDKTPICDLGCKSYIEPEKFIVCEPCLVRKLSSKEKLRQ